MIINNWILKNEKLASQMKAYQIEIERLDQLRDMIRRNPGPKNQFPYLTAARLKKIIASAREEFEMLNDMYDQETHSLIIMKEENGFSSMAEMGCMRLQKIFSELKESKRQIHQLVAVYCKVIETNGN